MPPIIQDLDEIQETGISAFPPFSVTLTVLIAGLLAYYCFPKSLVKPSLPGILCS